MINEEEKGTISLSLNFIIFLLSSMEGTRPDSLLVPKGGLEVSRTFSYSKSAFRMHVQSTGQMIMYIALVVYLFRNSCEKASSYEGAKEEDRVYYT